MKSNRSTDTQPTPDRNNWRQLHFTPGTAALIAALLMCFALLIAGMNPLVNPLPFAGIFGGAALMFLVIKRRRANIAQRDPRDRS